MRVEKKLLETKVVEEYHITEVVCNKCGCTSGKLQDDDSYAANEFQEFGTYFGYGSRFDMERWSFDLCEDCLVELIKTFKHSPSGFAQENYFVHNEQLTFEKWKETGQIDIEAGMTLEEIEERGGSLYGDWEDEDDE